MEKVTSGAWVDECAKAIHRAFSNMVPSSWVPDGFSVLGLLQGAFIEQLHLAVINLKRKGVPIAVVAHSFSNPSTLHAALYFANVEYRNHKNKDKVAYKETVEYLVELIYFLAKKDPWIERSNIVHSPEEITALLETTPFLDGNQDISKELGRLYVSSVSLAYSLYGDFFPQEACDIYGPYDVSKQYGAGAILLIKHFPKLTPEDLWPQIYNREYSDVKIIQIYKNIEFACEFIGMHSLYKGDTHNNLITYAVSANGSFIQDTDSIKQLRTTLAEKATEQSKIRDAMTKEDIKNKFLYWLGYQYNEFFKLADMNWKPTPKMLDAIKNKEIPDKLVMTSMPPYDEFIKSPDWEIVHLKELYR